MIKFTEEFECKADNKGRIMLPSVLRTKLAPVLQEGLVIKRSIFESCLEVYTMKAWEKEMEKVGSLNRFRKKNNDFIRQFTAGVRTVEIDVNGRVLIPKNLLAFAGITKDVVLSASIDRIEVWDKGAYNEILDKGAETFSALAEEVMGNSGKEKEDDIS
ncbi:MAG: division/cell wall cluster transcriptional repressor MraZ [Bacteroidota bacterium]